MPYLEWIKIFFLPSDSIFIRCVESCIDASTAAFTFRFVHYAVFYSLSRLWSQVHAPATQDDDSYFLDDDPLDADYYPKQTYVLHDPDEEAAEAAFLLLQQQQLEQAVRCLSSSACLFFCIVVVILVIIVIMREVSF